MKKTTLALAVAGALALPAAAAADNGDSMTVYGKIHLSVDAYDNDRAAPNDQSGVSLSSNSSRVGFKGHHSLENGMQMLWKVEQQVDVDESGGNWATRNTYAGLKGGFGTLIAGYHDTPYKDIGGEYTLFGDTIGDRRAIVGAFVGEGNKMNNRGKNALMYVGDFGPMEFRAMYAADQTGGSGADNNDNDMTSASLMWKSGPASVGVAYADYSDLLKDGASSVTGIRVGAGFGFGGGMKVQAIYETTSSDDNPVLERDVYGANFAMPVGSAGTLGLQYLAAGDYKNSSNTGATMASIGYFRKLDRQTQVYAMYSQTSNDDGADFQGIDGGHGDEVKTDLGGSPSAFSLGLVYKF